MSSLFIFCLSFLYFSFNAAIWGCIFCISRIEWGAYIAETPPKKMEARGEGLAEPVEPAELYRVLKARLLLEEPFILLGAHEGGIAERNSRVRRDIQGPVKGRF